MLSTTSKKNGEGAISPCCREKSAHCCCIPSPPIDIHLSKYIINVNRKGGKRTNHPSGGDFHTFQGLFFFFLPFLLFAIFSPPLDIKFITRSRTHLVFSHDKHLPDKSKEGHRNKKDEGDHKNSEKC